MNIEFPAQSLNAQVRSLSLAASPSEVFKRLLEGSRLGAPRAAVFLLRQGQIKGWGSVGYAPDVVQRQRSFAAPSDSGWLGGLASSHQATSAHRESPGQDPDFGQVPPGEAIAFSVRVKQRAIALLLAERTSDEGPWFPAALELMVTVAQLRLDLDLLQRKLGIEPARQPAVAPVTSPPVPAAIEVAPTSSEPATPPPFIPLDLPGAPPIDAPAADVAEPPPAAAPVEDDPRYEAARRYARLVATDIRLYNEEAVMLGRRNGDLVDRLGADLKRGKDTFLKRHDDLGEVGLQILRDAYVQVLAGGDVELLPESVIR